MIVIRSPRESPSPRSSGTLGDHYVTYRMVSKPVETSHREPHHGHMSSKLVFNKFPSGPCTPCYPFVLNRGKTHATRTIVQFQKERHTKIKTANIQFFFIFVVILGRPVPCDVYKRLADLEEKILHLEGLSPEYFRQSVSINSGSIISILILSYVCLVLSVVL